MFGKRIWTVLSVVVLVALVFGGCVASQPAAPSAAPAAPAGDSAAAPASDGGVQIPDVVEGKYNVAFVYVGPHDDGGWSQAHDVGRQYVEANMENVHTAYIENVFDNATGFQHASKAFSGDYAARPYTYTPTTRASVINLEHSGSCLLYTSRCV